MSLSLKVHHFEQRAGQTVMTKVTPYVRVSDQSRGAVFLQAGNAFGEGGPSIKPFPLWVLEHVEQMEPRIRKEIGFTDERIAFLKQGGKKSEEPDLDILPAPREDEPQVTHSLPQRTLTSEEAEAMDFQTLKAYAAQYDITSNGKANLIEKLIEEGHIA